MSRWVVWSLVALLLSGCQRHAKPESTTPPETAAAAPANERPQAETREQPVGVARPATATPLIADTPVPAATAKERTAVDDLVRAAETVRQLKLRRAVSIEIEDGEAIANSLRAQIEEDEIERARILYGALGLLDAQQQRRLSPLAPVLQKPSLSFHYPR